MLGRPDNYPEEGQGPISYEQPPWDHNNLHAAEASWASTHVTSTCPSPGILACPSVWVHIRSIPRSGGIGMYRSSCQQQGWEERHICSNYRLSKAFDCVWHDYVLGKRFLTTSGNSAWSLLALLMSNTQVRIRLGDLRSRPVTLNQGVGQGRIPSTDEYKLHLDNLIHILESTNICSHIGPFFCGAPTCADDVMLMAIHLLGTVSIYSMKERYHINLSKTTVSIHPDGPRAIIDNPTSSWTLGDATIEPPASVIHLGLNRFAGKLVPNELIDACLELARTRYATIGCWPPWR